MFLYHIFVRPIEYLIEVIFRLIYDLLDHPGYALFFVSLSVSFLVLPLYLKADAIQETEQQKQKSMERWITHIRKTFQGDERYMMINSFYREQDYRPLYALRGTISLLLQVPFFIAAYHYLSHLSLLEGVSFGPIADLAKEDALIVTGSIRWNLLPILMTAINAISTAIYTRGFTLKQKLQPYLLALLFLVLLYRSPSGLVIYWTMNNLFSLIKNAVMKYAKHPRYVVGVFLAFLAALYLLRILSDGQWGAAFRRGDIEELVFHLFVMAALCLPLILTIFRKAAGHTARVQQKKEEKGRMREILLLELTLTVFLGCFIPMSVISSSPADFINIYHYFSPMHYMFTTLFSMGGLFLFWGSVIAYMADEKGKKIFAVILFLILCVGLLDFMCFHVDAGTLSMELTTLGIPKFARLPRMVNAVLILVILFAGTMLVVKLRGLTDRLVTITLLAMVCISAVQIVRTETTLQGIRQIEEKSDEDTSIRLSKDGKNVVILMLDRSMACYIPYIFDEKPELYEKFDGFTLYPNTVSFGLATNYGAPALYGGYDYTTRAINARKDELLKDKHNESLLLLPTLFTEAGYHVTVWDPPYANYAEPSDLSIYDDLPDVDAHLMQGRYEAPFGNEAYHGLVERNFFFYSVMKAAPTLMQDEIYDGGDYLSTSRGDYGKSFMEAYALMDMLPELTTTDGAAENTCFQMCSILTHEIMELQLPDYVLQENVDNSDYPELTGDRELDGRVLRMAGLDDSMVGFEHYQANMAAMLLLGEWFDKLREEGVYDNTRIILVGDHGRSLRQFEDLIRDVGVDVQAVNCLLMVKDFNASGFTTDERFMTNADTPVIAMEGIIDHPVNPFTGNPVTDEAKAAGADIIWEEQMNIGENHDTVFLPLDATWYHVNDNIFEDENWTRVE